MEDPALNSQLIETKELQTRWRQFSDFVEMAYAGKPIKPEADMKFMELKSRIAMLHDSFMESLEHDQGTGQNMMELLNDCVTLPRLLEASEADRKKFKFDWNECYILVTEQISHLVSEQERLAGVNERAYRATQRKDAFKAKVHNFFTGAGFKSFIWFGSLVMVVYIIPAYIWSYRNIASIPGMKKIYVAVVNNGYRPYIDHEYTYNDMSEADFHPDNTSIAIWKIEPGPPTAALTASIVAFFPPAANSAPLNDAISKNTMDGANGFLSEHVSGVLANNPAHGDFYFLMFKDGQMARDFCDLMLKTYKALPDAERTTVDGTIYLHRKANMVAIGMAQHVLREGYVKEKLGLPDNTVTFLR